MVLNLGVKSKEWTICIACVVYYITINLLQLKLIVGKLLSWTINCAFLWCYMPKCNDREVWLFKWSKSKLIHMHAKETYYFFFLTMHKISFLALVLPSGNCCLNWDVLTWIPLFNRMDLFLAEFARRLFSSFISQWTKPMLWQYLITEITWGIYCCYRLLAEGVWEGKIGFLWVVEGFVRACMWKKERDLCWLRREGSNVFSTFSCRDL